MDTKAKTSMTNKLDLLPAVEHIAQRNSIEAFLDIIIASTAALLATHCDNERINTATQTGPHGPRDLISPYQKKIVFLHSQMNKEHDDKG